MSFTGRRTPGANMWGNVTSNPHLCPQLPPEPQGPLRRAVMSFRSACICLPTLELPRVSVLCVTHAVDRRMPGPMRSKPPAVCTSSKPGRPPVLDADARPSSTSVGPRCPVLLPRGRALPFWLLLHSNAQPSGAVCSGLLRGPAAGSPLFHPCSWEAWGRILCKHIWTSSDHMTATSAA